MDVDHKVLLNAVWTVWNRADAVWSRTDGVRTSEATHSCNCNACESVQLLLLCLAKILTVSVGHRYGSVGRYYQLELCATVSTVKKYCECEDCHQRFQDLHKLTRLRSSV